MKKRPDSASIQDIVSAARLAQAFVEGLSKEDFIKDLKSQAAICRQLEIIGEAATRLSPEFRKSTPKLPWRAIIGMRNILIHLYEEVDSEDLSGTVKGDLPDLIEVLRTFLTIYKTYSG
jgi:uncharacterized protein with HEPN domain